jgi:hypothetical protein
MFNLIPVTLSNVLLALALALLLVVLAMVLFYHMWVRRTDFLFPRGNYKEVQKRNRHSVDEEEHDGHAGEYIKTKTLRDYLEVMRLILWEIDPEYWMRHVGFDGKFDFTEGYSYIVFQRQMIKSFFIFFGANVILFVASYLLLNIYEGSGV